MNINGQYEWIQRNGMIVMNEWILVRINAWEEHINKINESLEWVTAYTNNKIQEMINKDGWMITMNELSVRINERGRMNDQDG